MVRIDDEAGGVDPNNEAARRGSACMSFRLGMSTVTASDRSPETQQVPQRMGFVFLGCLETDIYNVYLVGLEWIWLDWVHNLDWTGWRPAAD